jgi:uncharacterized phage-like protein YoqJ
MVIKSHQFNPEQFQANNQSFSANSQQTLFVFDKLAETNH